MTAVVRELGLRGYEPVWQEMRDFTERRGPADADELWLVEHPPVFTLGLNGRRENVLAPGDIPVLQVDRGGQVTYHGPGQAVMYVLLDLHRLRWPVHHLVAMLEQSVIDAVGTAGVRAQRRPGAPGVYVGGRKLAALGLRVRRGCSYHGLALNVDLDLAPFLGINPCGYAGMEVTRLEDLGVSGGVAHWHRVLADRFQELLRTARPARHPELAR
ncbi:MAG: lipoyl(octanoyl) transferase LipB [Gammaproteobacteria bacterium]